MFSGRPSGLIHTEGSWGGYLPFLSCFFALSLIHMHTKQYLVPAFPLKNSYKKKEKNATRAWRNYHHPKRIKFSLSRKRGKLDLNLFVAWLRHKYGKYVQNASERWWWTREREREVQQVISQNGFVLNDSTGILITECLLMDKIYMSLAGMRVKYVLAMSADSNYLWGRCQLGGPLTLQGWKEAAASRCICRLLHNIYLTPIQTTRFIDLLFHPGYWSVTQVLSRPNKSRMLLFSLYFSIT